MPLGPFRRDGLGDVDPAAVTAGGLDVEAAFPVQFHGLAQWDFQLAAGFGRVGLFRAGFGVRFGVTAGTAFGVAFSAGFFIKLVENCKPARLKVLLGDIEIMLFWAACSESVEKTVCLFGL